MGKRRNVLGYNRAIAHHKIEKEEFFMLIIVKDGKLTEKKVLENYKWIGLFKVMNRISKTIERLENVNSHISYEEERIIRGNVRDIQCSLDRIERDVLSWSEELEEKEKGFWKNGRFDLVAPDIKELQK